ncbi:SRPBCC family protein [Undibacterium sp. Di27W]|uniref:SRPBCC family protein n=1 Tax=Undibacterium sp. Di27W TaxID=3413036 RepID=UPI003BF1932C
MSSTTETDRIERQVMINAPRERVWRALTTAEEFGTWFGANLKGQSFTVGQRTMGPIIHKGFEHIQFDVVVERIEPQDVFAYRWHPYPMDPAVDYDSEEPTTVTFSLSDVPGNGTLLTVVEAGFDKVPPGRRLEAFRMNNNGWEAQLRNIARHAEA